MALHRAAQGRGDEVMERLIGEAHPGCVGQRIEGRIELSAEWIGNDDAQFFSNQNGAKIIGFAPQPDGFTARLEHWRKQRPQIGYVPIMTYH